MPAQSKAQQKFMALCEHTPEKAAKKCPPASVAREYARTSRKGLPEKVRKRT